MRGAGRVIILGGIRLAWGGALAAWLLAGSHAAAQPQQDAVSGERRAVARWRVEIEAPDTLKGLLLNHLEVSRYREQVLVGGLGQEPAGGAAASITAGELRRLVANVPEQTRQLLATEGYFSPQVHAAFEPAVGPDAEAVVAVRVEPGPQTVVRSLALRYQGELDQRVEAHDLAAQALVSQIASRWALPVGRAFTQSAWASAKSTALSTLRAQGYVSASWSGTSARIDAQAPAVDLFLMADSGPLYRFGPLIIEGLDRVPPEAVRHLWDAEEGTPYTDKQLFDFQERLRKVGLFAGVSATVDPNPDVAGAVPVLVRLKEQPMQQSTFGVGYSANTGARVSLEQVSRRVFDFEWQAKTVLELGAQQSTFKTDFTSYPLPDLRHNLLSAAIDHLEAAGASTHSQSLKAGRSREEERLDRTWYLAWQRARVMGDGSSTEASAVSANLLWVRRALDSVMAPTRGFATSFEAGLGQSFATDQRNGPFARLLWRNVAYLPLPAGWQTSGRIDVGRVQSRPGVGVPDTLLFRTGGDDTVRGYAYRALGPTRDGVAVGARSMVAGSVELARPIWAHRPAWLWAVFFDAGDAADDVRDLQLKTGYGVGVRWRSPVGSLRIDLAHGQHVHETRLHLSLGMAF